GAQGGRVIGPALALLLLPGAQTEPESVESSVRRILAAEQFRFCHDPNFPLDEEEVGWCPLVGAVNSRCPSFPDACKGGATPLSGGRRFRASGRHGVHGGHGSGSGSGAGSGAGSRDDEAETRVLRLPNLGGLGQVLLWLMLGGGIVALV